MLRDTGSPMKASQLLKKCDVPKKRLNQVLYQMKTEQLVVLLDLATWGLSGGTTGELVPTEPARSSQGNFPSWGAGTSRPGNGQARIWAWVRTASLRLGARDVPSLCLGFLFWPVEMTVGLLHRVERG